MRETNATLRFISRFRGLFTKFGVDYSAMEAILRVKLLMDARRVPTVFNDAAKKKEGNQFLKSLWIYALYGVIIIPFLFLGDQFMFQMGISFGIIMFILATTMIADFSSVLLDVRDKTILGAKPINSRTANAAKLMHILIYMFYVAGALLIIPVIVGLFAKGMLFTLIFLADILLTIAFIVVLTSLLYLVVLRFFDGEKLKDLINYVQILLSVGTIIGYQVVARSFEFVNLDIVYTFSWWHLLLPPLWFGATFEALLGSAANPGIITGAALAAVIPLIAIVIYIRLIPQFEASLDKLTSVARMKKPKAHRVTVLLAKLTCRTKEERVYFRFATQMMRREREFKLKTYPVLGMALVFPFLFIVMELRERSLADIGTGNMFLFIYMCNFLMPTVINMLRYSGNYKGSWLFEAAPIREPQLVNRGSLKAMLATIYTPIFAVLSIIFTLIFSLSILPHLLAVFAAGLLQSVLVFHWTEPGRFPFSRSFEFSQDGGSMKVFFISLITLGFVGLHAIVLQWQYGVYGYLAVLLIANIGTWKVVFRKPAEGPDRERVAGEAAAEEEG